MTNSVTTVICQVKTYGFAPFLYMCPKWPKGDMIFAKNAENKKPRESGALKVM
jgi:hypothetical protein